MFRTFFLAASVLVATAVLPVRAYAQTPVEIPAPSETVYEIWFADGSTILGYIAGVTEELVIFITVGGGRFEIAPLQIKRLRPARGKVVHDKFWTEDPGSTRLFFTSTGRSLSRGEAYIGSYVVILPFAAYGITDRVTIAAGAPVLFGEFEPFYIAPKVQVISFPTVQVSLGTIAFFYDAEVVGLVYQVGTFGDMDKALSAGLGFFYSGDEVTNDAAFMVGGEFRISRRIKLITENYHLPEAVDGVFSGGIRIMFARFNAEVGAIGATGDGLGCCLPLLNISYAFGR